MKQIALAASLVSSVLVGPVRANGFDDAVTILAASIFYSQHCEPHATVSAVMKRALRNTHSEWDRDGERFIATVNAKRDAMTNMGNPAAMCRVILRNFGPGGLMVDGMLRRP